MPPWIGTAPAARLVPAPLGTIGTWFALAQLSTSATSSVLPGRTTASGTPENPKVASVWYGTSAAGRTSTFLAPTIRPSRAPRAWPSTRFAVPALILRSSRRR